MLLSLIGYRELQFTALIYKNVQHRKNLYKLRFLDDQVDKIYTNKFVLFDLSIFKMILIFRYASISIQMSLTFDKIIQYTLHISVTLRFSGDTFWASLIQAIVNALFRRSGEFTRNQGGNLLFLSIFSLSLSLYLCLSLSLSLSLSILQ